MKKKHIGIAMVLLGIAMLLVNLRPEAPVYSANYSTFELASYFIFPALLIGFGIDQIRRHNARLTAQDVSDREATEMMDREKEEGK